MSNFSSVPILDYSLLSSPLGRTTFINQLRHGLVNVGFLYLSNHPVSQADTDLLIDYIPKLFALPEEAKEGMSMINSQHFFGHSRLGSEETNGVVDNREQFDFATKYECRWKKGDPDYLRLRGPPQWPDEELIPGFRDVVERYLEQMEDLSYKFSSLIAEAFGLGPDGLAHFYDNPQQHRLKVIQYPVIQGCDQSLGAHYDPGFLVFLLQASPHRGLQVQNSAGDWIDALPIPGTFTINIGKALQYVTGGLARATLHRVLSPKGTTPRYSVAFSQNIGENISLANQILTIPPEIRKLQEERGDSVNFSEFDGASSGAEHLIAKIKYHPEVGERHYPELYKQIFPNRHSEKEGAY